MTRTSLLLIASVVAASGCRQSPPAPYPEWAKPDPPYSPSHSGANAFDRYVLASEAAMRAAPDLADRVSFLSGMKKEALVKLGPAMGMVDRAYGQMNTFEVRFGGPFSASPYARGWRLVSRAIVWRIEAAAEAGEYDKAVHWTLVATKFGFDLTQGDAETATLGFTVCDEARRALAYHFDTLSSRQLAVLHQGLSRLLAAYPGVGKTIANERHRMLLGVQFVQDCRRDRDYAGLVAQLGRESRQAANYLKNLDEKERPGYFETLAAAVESFAEHERAEAAKPRPERQPWTEPEDFNLFSRFFRAFSGTVEPMVDMADACVAKTRILAVSAWAASWSKSSGAAPRDLKSLGKSLTLDPYSGTTLVYNAAGPDFRVYSVGENGRDDGGDSDETGDSPDLVLESPGL